MIFLIFSIFCVLKVDSVCINDLINESLISTDPAFQTTEPIAKLITTTPNPFNIIIWHTRQTAKTTPAPTTTSDTCIYKKSESRQFGVPNYSFVDDSFYVEIANLQNIIVYSGSYVNAIVFNDIFGGTQTIGDLTNSKINHKTLIDLTNKQLVAINIRSGWWIDNLQFLTYDFSSNSYEWSQGSGGLGGSEYQINANRISKFAADLQITSITGTSDPQAIRTLKFEYIYQVCPLPGPTIPSTPHQEYLTTTPIPEILIASTWPNDYPANYIA